MKWAEHEAEGVGVADDGAGDACVLLSVGRL